MEEITLNSWAEFPGAIQEFRERYGGDDGRNKLLFRGQAESSWSLSATLERRVSGRTYSILDYSILAQKHAAEMRTVSGRNWKTIHGPKLREFCLDPSLDFLAQLPSYPFMVYLRQHGFPSPLLDWTRSPLIAAFFAFSQNLSENGDAAIYCYSEKVTKGYCIGEPVIHLQGSFVDTHHRHFTQQATYSICTRWDSSRGHVFCPHDSVFRAGEDDQDVLYRILIPRAFRKKVLLSLQEANINSYTLFQTEDSLISAIATRVFDLEG